MSPPVGPTGLRSCSGEGDEVGPWRAGVSGGWSGTTLELSGQGKTVAASFTKVATTASLERRLGDRWTLGLAAGATLEGALVVEGARYDVSPGPLLAATAGFRALDEGDVRPFVLLTAALSGSLAWTAPPGGGARASLTALDLRAGVAAGKTFAGVVTPYLAARAFGGPVFGTLAAGSFTGTDASHYQLGAGVVVRLGRLDVDVEGVPLGETALVGGVGLAF